MKGLYQILIGRSARAIFLYRMSSWLYRKRIKPVSQILWSTNVMLHAIEISPLSKIGKNLRLAHTVGTVIGSGVVIGDNVTIYQNITIGAKTSKNNDRNYPIIGNNVTIYPGSIIVGGINIGDNAIIGANSVVINDVPAYATVVGSPARIVN